MGIFISQWGIADRKKEYVSLNNSFKAAIISVDYDFDGGFYPSPRYFSLEQIAFIENFIAKKISVLEEQLKNKHFDLVVLPEALLDVELSDSADAKALTDFKISNNDVLIREFSGLAKRLKTPLLANFVTIREKNRYNSAVFLALAEKFSVFTIKTSLFTEVNIGHLETGTRFIMIFFVHGCLRDCLFLIQNTLTLRDHPIKFLILPEARVSASLFAWNRRFPIVSRRLSVPALIF